MHVEAFPDEEALSRAAAALIVAAVRERPSLLLCAATGASPTRTYARLAEAARDEPGCFDRMRVLKLDEWGGLPMDDPGSCEAYLRAHLVGPLGISEDRYVAFRSDAPDPEAECRRVDAELRRQGPIDLCVLGLGRNGHLALNEPADALVPHAHVAALAPETQQHPMIRHVAQPPAYGFTLGMAGILGARRILVLVSGAHKREPLERMLTPRITTHVPASLLWLHGDVTVLQAGTSGSGAGPAGGDTARR